MFACTFTLYGARKQGRVCTHLILEALALHDSAPVAGLRDQRVMQWLGMVAIVLWQELLSNRCHTHVHDASNLVLDRATQQICPIPCSQLRGRWACSPAARGRATAGSMTSTTQDCLCAAAGRAMSPPPARCLRGPPRWMPLLSLLSPEAACALIFRPCRRTPSTRA